MTELPYAILKNRSSVIAVVGATDHHEKFGSIIYRHLKRKGYQVLAVNPSRSSVDGDACYHSVTDLPLPPDIINIVTPPEITLKVLKTCLNMSLMKVWIQPGAADKEVIRFLEDHLFVYRVNDCIMMHT